MFFEITASDLPPQLSGCVFDGDLIIVDGQAFATYLPGILIASASQLTSSELPIAALNIAVNITTPDGDEESDFGTIILLAVGTIPPEEMEITSNPVGDPMTAFLTLIFQTIGIPPGTMVDFDVANTDIGSVMPLSPTVIGSEEMG